MPHFCLHTALSWDVRDDGLERRLEGHGFQSPPVYQKFMVKLNCMAEMVMLPLQRSVQVVLLYFITTSLHSKLKLNNVSHRAKPP